MRHICGFIWKSKEKCKKQTFGSKKFFHSKSNVILIRGVPLVIIGKGQAVMAFYFSAIRLKRLIINHRSFKCKFAPLKTRSTFLATIPIMTSKKIEGNITMDSSIKSNPKLFKWALIGVLVAGVSYYCVKRYR